MNLTEKRQAIVEAQKKAWKLDILGKARRLVETTPHGDRNEVAVFFSGIAVHKKSDGYIVTYEVRLQVRDDEFGTLVFSAVSDCAAAAGISCFRDGPWLDTFLQHCEQSTLADIVEQIERLYPRFTPV